MPSETGHVGWPIKRFPLCSQCCIAAVVIHHAYHVREKTAHSVVTQAVGLFKQIGRAFEHLLVFIALNWVEDLAGRDSPRTANVEWRVWHAQWTARTKHPHALNGGE